MRGIHPTDADVPRADAGLDIDPRPILVPGPGAAEVAEAASLAARAMVPIPTRRDDLQRISMINGEVERVLNVQGFCTYKSIAEMTGEEMRRLERILCDEGLIGRENWIAQARILMQSGGQTAYSRAYDRERLREAGSNSGCGHDAGL